MGIVELGVLAGILLDEMFAVDITPKETNAITRQSKAFIKLLRNNDKQAREFLDRINSGDIPREDVIVLLNEFLGSR
jgi:hypothetical protein